MKKDIRNISHFLARLIVMLGIVVGFLALTTAFPVPEKVAHSDKSERSTNEDDGNENAEVVLKTFEAINSSAQISLHHEYLLLETLPAFAAEEDAEATSDRISFIPGDKVLKILFRRIISPNAP